MVRIEINGQRYRLGGAPRAAPPFQPPRLIGQGPWRRDHPGPGERGLGPIQLLEDGGPDGRQVRRCRLVTFDGGVGVHGHGQLAQGIHAGEHGIDHGGDAGDGGRLVDFLRVGHGYSDVRVMDAGAVARMPSVRVNAW